ncbi:hypothetical protein B0H21DRAFT_738327 [Amylocystis lapponica]|nr:hypothetical protein B0H21DRAFT_738327 [Amylocystis lapponica]
MSVLRRLFQQFRRPTHFVGRDLEGNKFFEYPSVSDDSRRTKRVVKYSQGRDMWHYVAGERRLAVQWTSWLTHTRPDAPTLEELQADAERQRRVLLNESARQIAAAQDVPRVATESAPVASTQTPQEQPGSSFNFGASGASEPPKPESQQKSDFVRSDGQRRPAQPADEPQPWSPKTMRRAGG